MHVVFFVVVFLVVLGPLLLTYFRHSRYSELITLICGAFLLNPFIARGA